MSQLLALDGNILLWIQEHLRGPLDDVMLFITHLGDKGWIWIALGIVFLLFRKTRRGGVASLLALLIGLLVVNLGLKELVARVRPYEVVEGLSSLIGTMSSWSFPSGHTNSSFAAAVAIWVTLGRKFGIPTMILAVLISLSRLYIGVHYPTDVIGGAIVGTLCGLAGAGVVKLFTRKRRKRRS